jgi:hypothetical protein
MNQNHKTSIVVISLIMALLTLPGSCIFRSLEGNGILVKQQRQLDDFEQIRISGPINVYLEQGNKSSVVIQADENLTDIIQTTIDDNTLVVEWVEPDDTKVKPKNQVKVYITFKNIHTLKSTLVGNLECLSTIEADSLHVQSSGVGKMNLMLNCNTLTTKLSGVGSVTLSGNTDEAIIKNSSVGNLNAFELNTNKLIIKHSGVGNVEVSAEEEINIYATGVGNLYYSGKAVVGDLSVKGTGRVERR